jgi:CheY-like chemotaxis protein
VALLGLGTPALAQDENLTRLAEALRNDAADHRAYLESLYTITVSVLGVIFAAFGGILVYFGWKTLKDARDSVRNMVETEGRAQLAKRSDELLANARVQFEAVEAELRGKIKSLERAVERQQTASDVLFKAGSPASGQPAAPDKRRVLWVDDNPSNNESIAVLLQGLGAEVEVALSTDQALAKLQESTYDLIISDMGRVEGRDAGLDLLQKIRLKPDRTPFVIYASGNAVSRTRERALNLGALDAVASPTALMGRIKPLLFPEPS